MMKNQIIIQQMKELRFDIAAVIAVLLVALYWLVSYAVPLARLSLRKFGVEFGKIELSILRLSIIINKVELSPLDVPILQIVFILLFPSANARSESESLDYPWSKITIERLKVRLTTQSKIDSSDGFRICFPRPMFVVKMRRLVVEVEKAYIAPTPPADFVAMAQQLPFAISTHQYPELLKFDQRYHIEELNNSEIREADNTTFYIERWIKNAIVNMKNGSSTGRNPSSATDDDKLMNSWLTPFAQMLFQSVSFYIDSASVIISGAGSDIVKDLRDHLPPNEVNLQLAKLRKGQRSLAMIGASLIKISFSSERKYNALICFHDLQVKVGNPCTQQRRRRSSINNDASLVRSRWEWFTIVQPFDAFAELKGFLPFIIFLLDYDHYWQTRVIGIEVSVSSEISTFMSPNNLHTIFLHLDDWLDANSPFNQWAEWLTRCHQQTLQTSSTEKETYFCSFERNRLARSKSLNKIVSVSQTQMKSIENKMKCSEIVNLRCKSMKDHWLVPNESNEFKEYLKQSRSEVIISDVDDFVDESSSPFQRSYRSSLDALVALLKEKSSIFAPKIVIECHLHTVRVHFSSDENGREAVVPSIVSLSGVDFNLGLSNPLFSLVKNQFADRRRHYLDVSARAKDLHWGVCDDESTRKAKLPRFPDKSSTVGIAYSQKKPDEHVFDIKIGFTVAPTSQQDSDISVNLASSGVTLIVNPLPLLSAFQTLLELSQLPFQPISICEDSTEVSKSDQFMQKLSTMVNIDIDGLSVIFVIDLEEVSRGLLHFAVDAVKLKSTSLGKTIELVISNNAPFVLSAAQLKWNRPNADDYRFEWTMLPFKPILTISGTHVSLDAEAQSAGDSIAPPKMDIDVKTEVKVFELNASPSTTAALLGVGQSLARALDLNISKKEEEPSKSEETPMVDVRSQHDTLPKISDLNSLDSLNDDYSEVGKIIDINYGANSSYAEHLTVNEFEREKKFSRLHAESPMLSSELTLHNLVYFGDLREYSSMHEVYRITGVKKMFHNSPFPAPILWHRGQGVDLFWELYIRECGCTRQSLCGQETKTVQQKLVRSLCNYKFAKFCWKSIVATTLIHNRDVLLETNWLLDDDPSQNMSGPFANKLHSETETIVNTDQMLNYDISVAIVIDSSTLSFGSAQNFTKALFEARSSNASLSGFATMSKDGKIISDINDEYNDIGTPISKIAIKFCSGDLNVSYLTKHDNMDQFIEPFMCLGSISYRVPHHESNCEPSLSIVLKCPQTLFINVSPVLFETIVVAAKLLSMALPNKYKKVLQERDKRYLNNIYENFAARSSLNRDNSTIELQQVLQSHWQENFDGLSEIEVGKKVTALLKIGKVDDANIRVRLLDKLLKNESRCFFGGCRKLFLSNSSGVSIVATVGSENKTVEASCTAKFSLGTISIAIGRYEIISDVSCSPYQPILLKLIRSNHGRRKKKASCGFAPFLTLVPNKGSLDAIKLVVRSSIRIKSEIPIRVRIVRLPQKLGYLQKRNSKLIDLTKKNLTAALRRLVKGALIVHEMLIGEGSIAAVPLDIVLSAHYHALLFQDVSGEESDTWRDPVLLTKDYLFNELNLREVSKGHTMSGISIRKERINVYDSTQRRDKTAAADYMKSVWSKTAWDTTITVSPLFVFSNALPFPISIKAWQSRVIKDHELWKDPTAFADRMSEHSNDVEYNSDEETSSKSPSLMDLSIETEAHHNPAGTSRDEYYEMSSLGSGKTLRLCGINLSSPLHIQFSQKLRGKSIEWSNVATINMQKLRTGINPSKGSLSLNSIPVRLGENVDCFISTEVESGICRGALYSPFWIQNQTGMALEYRVIGTKDQHGISNKNYIDTGNGGLPVMLHCHNEGEKNKNVGKRRRKEISVIPVETPKKDVLGNWWEGERNGRLVMARNAINDKNNHVNWSERIAMDAAGTSGEVHCGNVVFSVSVESLAGKFFRSNLIRFTPRFVVRNNTTMPISLVPLFGSTSEALQRTRQLRFFLSDNDTRSKVELAPGESTVIYSFIHAGGVGKQFRWISFRFNETIYEKASDPKWHLVRLDRNGSTYLGEVDRRNIIVGIVDVTVSRSAGCSLLCTISPAAVAPYQIENRSSSHYLRFAQDDEDSIMFELPPMNSCGYAWDNPSGRKRLRVEVVNKQDAMYDFDNVKKYEGTYAFGPQSRIYKFDAGRKETLPHYDDGCYFRIHSHCRISAGTKILSFSDSGFTADAVETGMMGKNNKFDNSMCDIDIEGLSLSIIDSYPTELLALTVRDVSISKPVGSNATKVMVRHFQVDAMDPKARYPIIIQPVPLGNDHRMKPESYELTKGIVRSSDLFWMENADERPSPVFEANFKYVPQENMIWIPSLSVILCPMKVCFDLDYILKVTSVFLGTITDFRGIASESHNASAAKTNDRLQYSSRGTEVVSLTYLERLTIAPVWFEIEICINDYVGGDGGIATETALSLNSIAQASNSSSIAGIVGWVVNVGSNFAHVTPCFNYPSVAYIDKFCDPIDLVKDIIFFYVVQTIKQSLKVIFSMQFLGDPTLLALQLRTGISDLVWKTRDEVRAGGKDGFGRGIASFSENVIGATFIAVSKVSKSIAKTTDALVTSELTSKYLKPKELDKRIRPRHAIDGFVQGTQFFGRELIHGTAGLIGGPYRGFKNKTTAKGIATGVGGLFVSPIVATFGLLAISTEGLGATAKYLELSEIHARCRPRRVVPWGMPLSTTGLGFLKAIGIRVHTVRYQKLRKAALLQDEDEGEDFDYVTSREHKRILAAEMRRTNPPSKVLRISYKKENRRYTTTSINPKLLTDHPGSQTTSHYAAVFEQTLTLRTTNLQLEDEVKLQFRNNKNGLNTSSSTLGECRLRVGDMISHIMMLHENQLSRKEWRLSEDYIRTSDENRSQNTKHSSLIVPAPQEFTLIRPPKKLQEPIEDLFEEITSEIRDIQRCEEERETTLDSESMHSYSSFPGNGRGKKKDDTKSIVSKNERLFGSISLSFFAVEW